MSRSAPRLSFSLDITEMGEAEALEKAWLVKSVEGRG